MSNTDSFIEEVTEEVRRDKLFALMRKWGWLVALIIVGLVGGAAYNEWSKARSQAQAQAFGDAVLAGLAGDANPTLLEELPTANANQELVKTLLLSSTRAPRRWCRDCGRVAGLGRDRWPATAVPSTGAFEGADGGRHR